MSQEEVAPVDQGDLTRQPLQKLQELVRRILRRPQATDIPPEGDPAFEKLKSQAIRISIEENNDDLLNALLAKVGKQAGVTILREWAEAKKTHQFGQQVETQSEAEKILVEEKKKQVEKREIRDRYEAAAGEHETVIQETKKDPKQMTISELTDPEQVKRLTERKAELLQQGETGKELDEINKQLALFTPEYIEEIRLLMELEQKKPLELMQMKLSAPQDIKELVQQVGQRRRDGYYKTHSQEVDIDRRQLESLIRRQRLVDDLLRRLGPEFLVELAEDLKPKSS